MKFELVQLSPSDTIGPSFAGPKTSRTRRLLTKTSATYALLFLVTILGYFWVISPVDEAAANALAMGGSARDEQPIVLDVELDVAVHKHSHKHVNVHHHHHHHHSASAAGGYRLNKDQKLAAITAYILSPLHSNSLPLTRDIEVEDLLEFDINGPRADEMVHEMVTEIWEGEQVVIFGKLHHPPTRNLQALVKSWSLPRPSIVHLDKRQDGVVLERALRQVITSEDDEWSLPLLLIRGKPLVGLDHIKALKETGELEGLLNP
ncbi:hypothetical protein DL96DRAFT_1712643 [Flagelloscypha sp. PMI_526]|nr:hypothetical protein DL96DRAFT_1712643 [Flagelloscypha sp. PMI_526]